MWSVRRFVYSTLGYSLLLKQCLVRHQQHLDRRSIDRNRAKSSIPSSTLFATSMLRDWCSLDPDHIVAVGDRIKLSTDALRDAGTSSAYRKDVRLSATFWPESTEATSAFAAYQIVSTMECWCQARFEKVGVLAKCINWPPASQPILRDGKTRPKRPCGPSHATVRRSWPNLQSAPDTPCFEKLKGGINIRLGGGRRGCLAEERRAWKVPRAIGGTALT